MKIVIIEDEKLTAKDLIKTIKSVQSKAEIVIQLASVEDAITFFDTNPSVDLIFSDIQLGDGNSFEIFEKKAITTPIIFCTAFNDYALKAFETLGIDYVLKPFSKTAIEKAIQKFETITKQNTTDYTDYKALFNSISKQLLPTKLPNIIIHQADKIIPIAGDKIALFFIEHGIVKALSFENKKFVTNHNLEELELKFSPHFFRTNRQFLVNRTAVREATQHFNRKLLVQLSISFTEQILVGKEKIGPFLDWLSNH